MLTRIREFGLCLCVLLIVPSGLQGHKLESGQAVLTISHDRVWILELEFNLTRYIQSNPELADTVRPLFQKLEKGGGINDENFAEWETLFEQSEEQFRGELKVIESGNEVMEFKMWFPHPSELQEFTFKTLLEEGLHVKIFGSGKLQDESSMLQFRFPLDIGEVILTTLQPQVQWVVTGELSFPVSMIGGGSESTGGPVQNAVLRFLRIGFTHIIPGGLDHILFVFGLFLLSPKLRPLLVQVTSFTVAHTLTLGLSIYGIFSLPSGIVEPLIALSIVLVAVENVLTDKIHPWRPGLVFLFGLLHGLGFAGALGEIGLPQNEFLSALVFFNLGVEFGQLTVVLIALLLIGAFRKKSWYRIRLTIPLSCAMGLTGLYWTVERLFF